MGPKTFVKSHRFFLVAIATEDDRRRSDDVLFWFRASLDSELHLIGDMSGRKERSEGDGVGIKLANADKADEVVEKEEVVEEEEEEEWKSADANAER